VDTYEGFAIRLRLCDSDGAESENDESKEAALQEPGNRSLE
jgi:hypothetical protein